MEGEGVPIRFPAIAELEVDSFDRYTNQQSPIEYFLRPTTSSQIVFNSPQSLLSGYFTRVAVSELLVQWRTPNINPRNNTFFFECAGAPPVQGAVTLTTGFYDLSGLATAMVVGMNNIAGAGTFRADLINLTATGPDTRGIAITHTGGRNFFFAPTLPSDFKFMRTAGMETINTNAANPQIFAVTTDLAYTHYIDIVSDRLSKFSKVKDSMTRQRKGLSNVLVRVYLTPFNTKERFVGTSPFTSALDYTTPKNIRWNPEEYINDFDLTVYDEYGDVLYWDPLWSTEYQFNLQASET